MLEYTIDIERPWVFAILAVAAVLILLPYFLTPRNKRRSFGRIFSLVLRCVSVVIMTFILSGVTVTETLPKPKEEAMVIVVDYSDSLSEISDKVESYVGTLLESKAPSTEVRLVKFSGNAVAATSAFTTDGTAAFEEFCKTSIDGIKPTDSTDISAALDEAGRLFGPGEYDQDKRVYKRVVLISDGRETTGSAWEAAAKLDADSIRLDTITFDVTKEVDFAEVAMLSLGVLPEHVVDAGTTVRLQVKIRSSVDTDGVLHFYDGEEEVERYPVSISVGDNIFSKSYRTSADETGLHELRVRFEPKRKKDAISENNELGTWIKVTGTPRVLLVGSDAQTSKLYDQVKNVFDTDCCKASDFPRTMKELLRYDEVVLMDVSMDQDLAEHLPTGADEMLNRFVHDIGRGLLTTSGMTQGTYMSYSDNESILADMLPVSMTLDETEHNIAIVLVIDDSSSMIPGAYSQTGSDKFQPALDGAQKVIEALGENDYIGVVTFHQEATVQLELTKPEHPEELIELVQNLSALNHFGTDYSKGLNAARDMLVNFDGARSKHVIFLSDGFPTRGDFSQLPTSMKNAGISVSTIALLTDSGAKDTLADIAKEGGGKAFAIDKAEDLDSLANIMEDLTVEAKEPQFINTEPFNPIVGKDTGVLNQVQAANMTLGGYIGSTVKNGADMPLQTKDFRPLIAEWKWGKGHVTTLMMDLTSPWCAEFFSEKNNGYGLIKNLVTQSINDEEVKISGITMSAKQSDRTTHLTVNTSCYEKDQMVKVYVYDDPSFFYDTKTVDGVTVFFDPTEHHKRGKILSSAGGTKYTGTLDLAAWAVADPSDTAEPVSAIPVDPNRTYYLCITQYSTEEYTNDNGETVRREKDVLDYTVVAYSGGILAEYDIYNTDGTALMEGIAVAGGGGLMTSTRDLFSIVKDGADEYHIDLLLPCSIAVACLLMVDILVRNIHFGRKKKNK